MRRFIQLFLLFVPLVGATLAPAQGGPPFITDDPGTPGNRQWEINVGWIGNHNPAHASYQLPNIDINYGWGDRIQLMFSPYLAAATDENNTTRAGLGETVFGVKWRYFEHHSAGQHKSDENMNFSLGTYPQVTINNPTSTVRRGIVEPGPQYYLQDVSRMGTAPKQRALTVDVGGRQTLDRKGHLRLLFMGGRGIHAVTRQNSEPDWMAYVGVQILFGPNEASENK